mgnify:CR=1 FL=1
MGNSYANMKKKDLLAIVADSSRTELETALAVKCLRLEKEVGRLNDAVNDFFQCLYSVDRFLGKFKSKHSLAERFRSKALANEIGELRARLRNDKQDTNSLSTIYPPEKEENQEATPANDAG